LKDKIKKGLDKAGETAKKAGEKANKFAEEKNLNEKIKKGLDKVEETAKKAGEKANKFVDENEQANKASDKMNDFIEGNEKVKGVFDKLNLKDKKSRFIAVVSVAVVLLVCVLAMFSGLSGSSRSGKIHGKVDYLKQHNEATLEGSFEKADEYYDKWTKDLENRYAKYDVEDCGEELKDILMEFSNHKYKETSQEYIDKYKLGIDKTLQTLDEAKSSGSSIFGKEISRIASMSVAMEEAISTLEMVMAISYGEFSVEMRYASIQLEIMRNKLYDELEKSMAKRYANYDAEDYLKDFVKILLDVSHKEYKKELSQKAIYHDAMVKDVYYERSVTETKMGRPGLDEAAKLFHIRHLFNTLINRIKILKELYPELIDEWSVEMKSLPNELLFMALVAENKALTLRGIEPPKRSK
jgi:hypothetical protein